MKMHHTFSAIEIDFLRKELLTYYKENKRDLPWRNLANTLEDTNQRAYSVWVSEIMLQQTQVVTVIEYYNKWIKRWPTVSALAKATLEEVNEMWSGLGYYSRGRRLYEGAQKINKKNGNMPQNAKDLMKHLPGVGRYTAGAIASIAYNEVTGIVDGNVMRVMSRLRMIGADFSLQAVNELFWELANAVVDLENPGDFNQSMMEIGATICTPKSPQCSVCPLNKICKAYYKSSVYERKSQTTITDTIISDKETLSSSQENFSLADIEDVPDCKFCLSQSEPWDPSLGVTNYPRKAKKKPPRAEKFISIILEQDNKFLFTQRPDKGLLAGMWEFPLTEIEKESNEVIEINVIRKEIKRRFSLGDLDDLKFCGEVTHVFSHRFHFYRVYHGTLSESPISISDIDGRAITWMTKAESADAAITSAIKKIILLNDTCGKKGKRKRKTAVSKGQLTLDKMLTKKTKNN